MKYDSVGYGRMDWTATKDGHLQISAGEHRFRIRFQEEGVHTRGSWEEQVRRYKNVSSDWSAHRHRELPTGSYEASGPIGRPILPRLRALRCNSGLSHLPRPSALVHR